MQLGRYTLLGKLATGGMAEVFLARLDGTSGFERRVVIKRVLPQYATNGDFLRLFEQEARFASFLSHPNIAQVSDFGVDGGGGAYLVMEYVDGASLRTLLKAAAAQGERPDVRLVCRVFCQLAEALAAVHAAVDPTTHAPLDLVHRDVSPENVLLSRNGAVKLADFGIARAMTEVSTTSPDVVRGKLRYLAPEQLVGEALGPALDIWALGVSLYETLALRRPFAEDNEGQTVHAIVNGTFEPLQTLRPDLPPELIAVVERCLRRDPSARFPDCHELALELERIASARSGSVTSHIIGNWVERLAPVDQRARLEPVAPAVQPSPVFEVPVAATTEAPTRASAGREESGTQAAVALPLAPEGTVEHVEAPRRRWGALAAVVLALISGAAVLARHRAPAVKMRQVLISSFPAGASVHEGTTLLGNTPWAGDLPRGSAVEIELSSPGYHSVKRTLPAGDDASLDVTLKHLRR